MERVSIVLTGNAHRKMKLSTPTMMDLLMLCSNARSDEIEQYEALIGPWNMDDAANGFY